MPGWQEPEEMPCSGQPGAITLTLLALNLKLPDAIPAQQLDSALVGAILQLFAYALSFVIAARTRVARHFDLP